MTKVYSNEQTMKKDLFKDVYTFLTLSIIYFLIRFSLSTLKCWEKPKSDAPEMTRVGISKKVGRV